MNCHNCGHADAFVLLADFAVTVPTDGSDGPSSPELSLSTQCPACESTDVGADGSDLLARYAASIST
ncbi:hypothetical protein [Halorussus halophilus]|uniref:hypothetical protein n=1 Tax=Halorussus halophilus TaxID=2650975 RepID=UPI0013015A32|nr:hypothetical protein [Halorussus halophilus]